MKLLAVPSNYGGIATRLAFRNGFGSRFKTSTRRKPQRRRRGKRVCLGHPRLMRWERSASHLVYECRQEFGSPVSCSRTFQTWGAGRSVVSTEDTKEVCSLIRYRRSFHAFKPNMAAQTGQERRTTVRGNVGSPGQAEEVFVLFFTSLCWNLSSHS